MVASTEELYKERTYIDMTWYRVHLELGNCNDVDWKKLVELVNPSDKVAQRKKNNPQSNEVNHKAGHQHRNIIERLEMKYGVSGVESDDEEAETPPPTRRTLATIDEYEDDDFIDDSDLQELAEGDDMTRRTSTKTKGFFVTDRTIDTTTSDKPATEARRLVVRRKNSRPYPISPHTAGGIEDSKKAKISRIYVGLPPSQFDQSWYPDAKTVSSIKAFQEVYEHHMETVTISNKAEGMPKELLPQLHSMDRSVHEKIPLAHRTRGYYQALADFIPLNVQELHYLIVSLDKAAVLNDHVSRWTKKVREAKLSDIDEKATGIATGAAGWIMPMDLREGLLELYDISQIWVDAENLALKAMRPGSQLLSLYKERQRVLQELEKVVPKELGLDTKALKKNIELERRRQRVKHKQKIAMKKKSVEDGAETGGEAASDVAVMKIDNSQGNQSAAEASEGEGGGSQSQSKYGNNTQHEEDQGENGDDDNKLAADMPPTGTKFALPSQGFDPLHFVVRKRGDKAKGLGDAPPPSDN